MGLEPPNKSPPPIQWKLQSNLLTLHTQRSGRMKFIDSITGEGKPMIPLPLIVSFQRVKHLISGSVNREGKYSPSDPLAPVGQIME